MHETPQFHTLIDDRIAEASDLAPLACAGFAHFTALQVRDGRVRGFDLHLDRLRSASLALFGRVRPDESVRRSIRDAVARGPAAMSLTATLFSRRGEFTPTGAPSDPSLLIRTGPASDGPAGPLRLAAVEHERWRPGIKHVGESAKTYFLRQAVTQGYDDALFVDRTGRISEATIWNLAFWDGEAVIWPEADLLPGITMGILRRQLSGLGIVQRSAPVRLDALGSLTGCVVMNSWTPAVAVSTIEATTFPQSDALVTLLQRAYRAEALLPI
ncbi:aminotransferase class IV family protein [Methylobacterium pseudosasicola]|uniref:Probable branched-chain-amino-acid aminotransferase n=1 Tax=Methylobacterium pseudosasicola TaxID=582667 RepID=A0A1I4RGC6_9HYPH|nr:aminotransferase class IV family protein [Methylobacterium pseudosasicola]SFM51314.1 Branched-chain amino acid aminotransferase/4-amino-4-deoxychorismate lyase [Methylobacterium pseudosasicola]